MNARGWRILAAVTMLVLTVPRLWQRGMFLDGVTYAVVARNLALGIGTLWAPAFSATTYAEFFEQPPLGMALQAVAFAVFGDHFAVERAFSIAVFGVNAWLIAALWRRLLPAAYDWLPVFLWLAPAVVTWAVINNMLEPTQAMFTSFACYALLRTADAASRVTSSLWSAGSTVSLVAAALTKGPVGLFPLAMPVLLFMLPRERRPRYPRVVWSTMMTSAAALGAAVALYEPSRRAVLAFSSSHLVPVLARDRGLGQYLGDVARHLTLGIGMRMAIVVAVIWLFRRRGIKTNWPWREAVFFFAVALAASLPILVSPVLDGHYFFASTPFFALGFGALALPAVSGFQSRPGSLSWRAPVWMASSLTVAAIVVLVAHGPLEVRSQGLIRDLDAIRDIAPVGQIVGACPASAEDWGLLNYFQRFYRISVQGNGEPASGWFLLASGGCATPVSCVPVNVETSGFTLLRCGQSRRP